MIIFGNQLIWEFLDPFTDSKQEKTTNSTTYSLSILTSLYQKDLAFLKLSLIYFCTLPALVFKTSTLSTIFTLFIYTINVSMLLLSKGSALTHFSSVPLPILNSVLLSHLSSDLQVILKLFCIDWIFIHNTHYRTTR